LSFLKNANNAKGAKLKATKFKCANAAKAAAPYVHARLQTTTLAGDPEKPLKVDSRSELDEARHLAFILSRAMKARAE
jgi:hypothetical protein